VLLSAGGSSGAQLAQARALQLSARNSTMPAARAAAVPRRAAEKRQRVFLLLEFFS